MDHQKVFAIVNYESDDSPGSNHECTFCKVGHETFLHLADHPLDVESVRQKHRRHSRLKFE